jgi:hypothetical protein
MSGGQARRDDRVKVELAAPKTDGCLTAEEITIVSQTDESLLLLLGS